MNNSFSDTSKIIMAKNCIISEIKKDCVVLDLISGKFLKINTTGKTIINEVSKEISYEELLLNMIKHYPEVSQKELDADIRDFIKCCMEQNLLKVYD